MRYLPRLTKDFVNMTRSAATANFGRLLAFGILGLGLTVAGCAEKEGVIELKKPPIATTGPSPDAPRKGPKRGPDRVFAKPAP